MNWNQNSGPRGFLERIPPVTRTLLLLNIGIWIICFVSPSFYRLALSKLALHYWSISEFNPVQLVTYQFLHGGFMHLFFNMFALYMFGSWLERVWGSPRYQIFYLVCGIGAGLIQETIWTLSWQHDYIAALAESNNLSFDEINSQIRGQIASGLQERMADVHNYQRYMLTIGASGAIFGLLVGFAFVFPNVPMYLFFIPVPVKAKWVVTGYGVLELVLGASQSLSSIAHYAHLGGMLFGLIMVLIWKRQGILHGKRF